MQKNILVVDDNDVNLELIVLLVEQYSREYDKNIQLYSAANGEEAVTICNEQKIDIVFMDYMMPKMNGDEATKIIKKKHPKTMVIVISAYGDEEKQKEMLRNGAEDYIVKPISSQLFKSRLRNYLQLIKNRSNIPNRPKAKNIFTTKVYNYHMEFNVSTESDLAEFWEAILIRCDFQKQVDGISDFVRFIYRLGLLHIQHKFTFHIIVEENEDNFFFTLSNMELMGCEKINSIIEKYYADAIYSCKGNALSFLLNKIAYEEELRVTKKSEKEVARLEPEKEEVSLIKPVTEEVKTFNILDDEELEEFESHLGKLRSLILLMSNSTIEDDDVAEVCECFNSMASLLSITNDTYVISNAIHELSSSIVVNQEYFKESSLQLFDFINAFVNDLIFWKTKIFYEGATSIDFLNDSIMTNANMLGSLLIPESQESENLDDIFDF